MINHIHSSAGIVCCFLFLAAGVANAEVISCTDGKGSVTYTDLPCTTDLHGVQAHSVIPPQPAIKRAAGPGRFAAAGTTRSVPAFNYISRGNASSLDESTVNDAKISADTSDIAYELRRQQASAERALNANRWAFWRL